MLGKMQLKVALQTLDASVDALRQFADVSKNVSSRAFELNQELTSLIRKLALPWHVTLSETATAELEVELVGLDLTPPRHKTAR
jgi:hypothetical protein